MKRKQFTFYESFKQAIDCVSDKADRAEIYDAICNYALYGIAPDLNAMSSAASMAFILIKPNLDSSRKKAAAGQAGGSKPKATEKQNASYKANGKQTAREKEIEKEIETECYNPLTPFRDNQRLQTVFERWVAYKDEKRQSYGPKGLEALIAKIRKSADTYGCDAVADLIEERMAGNFPGIPFDILAKRDKADEKIAAARDRSWMKNYN